MNKYCRHSSDMTLKTIPNCSRLYPSLRPYYQSYTGGAALPILILSMYAACSGRVHIWAGQSECSARSLKIGTCPFLSNAATLECTVYPLTLKAHSTLQSSKRDIFHISPHSTGTISEQSQIHGFIGGGKSPRREGASACWSCRYGSW